MTLIADGADLRVALVHQHAVKAVGVAAARHFQGRFALAPWDLRQVGFVDLHTSYRYVCLQRDFGQLVDLEELAPSFRFFFTKL